jgi:hypothetical protein
MRSSKYVARLVLGLLLISAALVNCVESGNLIGESLPALRYAPISFVVDLLLIGCGLSLCFSRTWRVARWPIMSGLALTLPAAVNSIRDVESMVVTKDTAWLWIVFCSVTIGCIAWATSGD